MFSNKQLITQITKLALEGTMRLFIFTFVLTSILISHSATASCNKQSHIITPHSEYYTTITTQTGEELKASLNELIKLHKKYNYTPCVWEILKEADVDPNNENNVIGLYTRRSIPKSEQDNGRRGGDAWNREHVWSKSHGFPNKNQHAYTDAHHLRAADRSVNTDRSNNDFANGGEPDDECTGCSEGDHTWEAPDEVKGDIARMMFYMVVRYEGNDSSNTPDLELVNRKTENGAPEFGKLCTLMEWHLNDSVDDSERNRNDIIQSWQGNRNPFIDRPEFAVRIWGEQCGVKEQLNNATLKQQILKKIETLEAELRALKKLVEQL
jgi:serine protease